MMKEPKNIKEIINNLAEELININKEIEHWNTLYNKLYLYKTYLEKIEQQNGRH